MSEDGQKGIGKAKIGLGISVALLVVSLTANAWLCTQMTSLNSRYNNYKASHRYSNSEYMELSINYTQLKQNHQTLTIQYETLTESYEQLNVTYHNLRREYEQFETAYQELNTTYYNLVDEYEGLESTYETLLQNYETLNNIYHSYKADCRKLVSTVNLHGVHPSENETLFITPDDPAVQDKVQEITGGWSDPTDWNEFWTEMKYMYDWVVNNIEYRYDGLYPILPEDPDQPVTQFGEMWQFPNQTLELGKGDCDDMAILLCSMIYCYNNMEYWVECIVITQHVAVYLPVAEDEICILDPAGDYYTNTGFPYYEITGKDISQEVPAWLDYWSDGIENPTVEWIFSSYIWQDFQNTGAFINWLFAR